MREVIPLLVAIYFAKALSVSDLYLIHSSELFNLVLYLNLINMMRWPPIWSLLAVHVALSSAAVQIKCADSWGSIDSAITDAVKMADSVYPNFQA
jgi:hypothetical protein